MLSPCLSLFRAGRLLRDRLVVLMAEGMWETEVQEVTAMIFPSLGSLVLPEPPSWNGVDWLGSGNP